MEPLEIIVEQKRVEVDSLGCDLIFIDGITGRRLVSLVAFNPESRIPTDENNVLLPYSNYFIPSIKIFSTNNQDSNLINKEFRESTLFTILSLYKDEITNKKTSFILITELIR